VSDIHVQVRHFLIDGSFTVASITWQTVSVATWCTILLLNSLQVMLYGWIKTPPSPKTSSGWIRPKMPSLKLTIPRMFPSISSEIRCVRFIQNYIWVTENHLGSNNLYWFIRFWVAMDLWHCPPSMGVLRLAGSLDKISVLYIWCHSRTLIYDYLLQVWTAWMREK